METAIIDNEVVRGHKLYRYCASYLQTVSDRDYRGKYTFNHGVECLDMDAYEARESSGQKERTVDAVIGIASFENNRKSRSRLLLVELRMKYKNTDNLSLSDMSAKVAHTTQLLTRETAIDKHCALVFSEKVAPRARRWLYRFGKEKRGKVAFEAFSVHDFNICIRPDNKLV